MKRIKFLHIIWALFYLTIFFILLNNSLSYMDPDLGWHLRVGEQILAERAVPSLEVYNYTLEGRTWVDHEWLINAVTYWIYDNFGYLALNVFFALMVIAALAILNLIARKYVPRAEKFGTKNGVIFIILFQALGVVASLPHLGVRMQEITLLNLAILLFIIYHYQKNNNWKILLWLPPLFYFWANVHAGFLIGIFIMFLWAFVKLVEVLLPKIGLTECCANTRISPQETEPFHGANASPRGADRIWKFFNGRPEVKKISIFSLFALIGAAATLLTPYGIGLYSFLKYYNEKSYLSLIQEWFPFYYLPIQHWQLLFLSLVVIAIATSLYIALKRRNFKKIPLWDIVVSVIFLALALKSKRHFPLLLAVSFPMLISFFSSFLDLPNDGFLSKKWRKQFFIVKPYIVIAFLIIMVSRLIGTNFTVDPFISFNARYPRGAVEFLKDRPEYDDLKLFNKYGWGGYLSWALPERKTFIDGRLPMLPFAGQTFLEEYNEFFDEGKTADKLKQYDIGLILMPSKKYYYKLNWFEKYFLLFNEEKVNQYDDYFKDYLEQADDWQPVYGDNASVIYVKI